MDPCTPRSTAVVSRYNTRPASGTHVCDKSLSIYGLLLDRKRIGMRYLISGAHKNYRTDAHLSQAPLSRAVSELTAHSLQPTSALEDRPCYPDSSHSGDAGPEQPQCNAAKQQIILSGGQAASCPELWDLCVILLPRHHH